MLHHPHQREPRHLLAHSSNTCLPGGMGVHLYNTTLFKKHIKTTPLDKVLISAYGMSSSHIWKGTVNIEKYMQVV